MIMLRYYITKGINPHSNQATQPYRKTGSTDNLKIWSFDLRAALVSAVTYSLLILSNPIPPTKARLNAKTPRVPDRIFSNGSSWIKSHSRKAAKNLFIKAKVVDERISLGSHANSIN